MFNSLCLKTTNDKILRIIIDNKRLDVKDMIETIKNNFPDMSDAEIESVLWSLSEENAITIQVADNAIYAVGVNESADACLRERHEIKQHKRSWDIVKILIGFILGVIVTYTKLVILG